MARPNLGAIITRAHRLAAIPEASSSRTSAVATQAEMIDEANAALAELYDIIIEGWEDILTSSTQLSMVAGENKTLLPADFYKLRTIYALVDSDQRRALDQWQMPDVASRRVTEAWDYPDYRLVGRYIEWLPTPSTTRTVEMYYVRQFLQLNATTDELPPEITRGWEEFVVGFLAEYLLDKRNLDPTPAIRRKEMARKRIQRSCSQRDASRPRRTIDVNQRYDGFRRRQRLPWPKV